jgi:hypothetical protein
MLPTRILPHRIQVPVKGQACTHLQCFDKDTWYAFMRGRRDRGDPKGAGPGGGQERCPLCRKEITTLVQDVRFTELLDKCSSRMNAVQVCARARARVRVRARLLSAVCRVLYANPSTRNTQAPTRDPQPKPINRQPSTVNTQVDANWNMLQWTDLDESKHKSKLRREANNSDAIIITSSSSSASLSTAPRDPPQISDSTPHPNQSLRRQVTFHLMPLLVSRPPPTSSCPLPAPSAPPSRQSSI